VAPVLVWMDRVEPEPLSSRVHAFLWGATIAIVVSGVVNSIVALNVSETAAAVVSAPLIEETMKGLAVVWALRRHEIDGAMDGLVYAGWAGLGFAVVEDVEYFLVASDDGVLAETFIARALLTPFAHPLFTAWTGLAIGLAVAKGRRVFPTALWGWFIAVLLHAAWNGSLIAAVQTGEDAIILLAALVFLSIFVGSIVMIVMVRRREQRRFVSAVPMLASRYGLRPGEVRAYGSWREVRRARRALPARNAASSTMSTRHLPAWPLSTHVPQASPRSTSIVSRHSCRTPAPSTRSDPTCTVAEGFVTRLRLCHEAAPW
jgi:protease PrsW